MPPTRTVLAALFLAACGKDVSSPVGSSQPSGATAASLTLIAGDNQVAAPGEAVAVAPTVLVRDEQGRPTPGVLVRFTVKDGGGTVAADTVRTGRDGTARLAYWRVGTLPGNQVLVAAVEGLPAVLIKATGKLLIPTTVVSGTLTLPEGSSLVPSTLRVSSALTDVPVDSNGAFTAIAPGRGAQLAAVEAPNGNAVLLGWIDGTHATFSVRTTASVLAFFDVAGFAAPTAKLQQLVRDSVAQYLNLGQLESAIAGALRGDPATATLATPAILAARKAVLAEIAAGRGAVLPSISIDPLQVKSGVAVDNAGLQSIILTNNWRRRAVAFIDKVSFVPKGSTAEMPAAVAGPPIDLPPVSAVTSVLATFIDILFGNLAYTPFVSSPQAVSLDPVGAQSTKYRVTVVGPGAQPHGLTLSPEQQDALVRSWVKTIVLDFVIPIVDQALSMNSLTQPVGAPEADNLVSKILDLNPEPLITAIANGDFAGACSEALKLLFDTSAGQSLLHEIFWVPFAAQTGKLEIIQTLDQKFTRHQRALQWFEIAATVVATANVFVDIGSAKQGEQWEVEVTDTEVKLNPPVALISNLEIQNFTAVVVDATGGTAPQPTFGYTWSTTGQFGKICAARSDQGNNYCGTSFTSSLDVITYSPDLSREGTDTIRVEVFAIENGVRQYIGETTATITTWKAKVSLTPQHVTVLPGGTATYTASIDRPLLDGGVLSYLWTTSGNAGNFGAAGTVPETTSPSIDWFAGSSEGTDFIAVEVFSTKNGIRQRVGNASASVEVKEDKPTTVMGSWFIAEPVPLDPGRSCVVAYVKFPTVPGAKSYELYAYGYRDTALGTTEMRRTFVPPFPAFKPCALGNGWGVNGLVGGEYQFLYSGGAGPNSSISNTVAWLTGRMTGMVVEVTVRY
jgi:hypothetical protein